MSGRASLSGHAIVIMKEVTPEPLPMNLSPLIRQVPSPCRLAVDRVAIISAAREEALRLYTAGSAWFAFDDDKRGTLEPGRLADLAVLDQDYLTVPAEALGGLQSVLTMVGGRIVHAAGPFMSLGPEGDK